jgi:hypothetical protein
MHACFYLVNCTAYDCKEDCSLYALDSGFLVAAGYELNSLQASHYCVLYAALPNYAKAV